MAYQNMKKIANNRLIYQISSHIFNLKNQQVKDIHITHFKVSKKYITVDFVYKSILGETFLYYNLKIDLEKVLTY